MTIRADLQLLSPSAIVELFEIDSTTVGGSLYRFHAGKNQLTADIVWNGNTYTAFPIEASGFEWTGKGSLPRPKVVVSNVLGTITALVLAYQDLVGCKFTRIRTLVKYLDAVNFPVQRNLISYSETLSNAAWVGSPSRTSTAVIYSGAYIDVAVWTLAKTTSTANEVLSHTFSSPAAGDYRTMTMAVYAGTVSTVQIGLVGGTSVWGVTGDTVGTIVSGPGLITAQSGGLLTLGSLSATVPTVLSIVRHYLVGETGSLYVYPGTAASTTIGDSVGVAAPQVEAGSASTTYQQFLTGTWSSNPTADPTAEFARDIFYIDRKSSESLDYVEFELAASLDLAGVALPRRQIVQNYCPWAYRGAECGYAGTNYFDTNDATVGTLGADVCGKRLSSCRARFGAAPAELPYGGFPAAGLVKA